MAPASPVSDSTRSTHGSSGFNDTNYIFLPFVTHYFPVGVIGLVIAVILNAAMSSSSGRIELPRRGQRDGSLPPSFPARRNATGIT